MDPHHVMSLLYRYAPVQYSLNLFRGTSALSFVSICSETAILPRLLRCGWSKIAHILPPSKVRSSYLHLVGYPILELLFFALVPLLNRAKKPNHSTVHLCFFLASAFWYLFVLFFHGFPLKVIKHHRYRRVQNFRLSCDARVVVISSLLGSPSRIEQNSRNSRCLCFLRLW